MNALASTRIKFCGLTRRADVDTACALGVDYIGLVLAADSPRCIDLSTAVALAEHVRAHATPAQVVLLLRNAAAETVAQAVAAIQPAIVQFHGDETEAYCAGFDRPYWKAIGMAGVSDPNSVVASYPSAAALLLDAHAPGAAGGSGQRLDWTRWPLTTRPLVLAGGLNADNVGSAIQATRPFAVDVSSGIESAPGIKDAERMRTFVAAVRSAGRRET